MMRDFVFFNHHCLPCHDKKQVDLLMPEFLKLCLRTSLFGLKTIVIDQDVDAHWFRIELTPGYYWQDWYSGTALRDPSLKEQVQAFLRISTRQPFFLPEELDAALLFDVEHGESKCSFAVLKAAVWHDAGILSIPTRGPWNVSPIMVQTHEMNDANEIREKVNKVENLYSLDVFSKIEPLLIAERHAAMRSGKEIWENRKTLFPHLEFCGSAPDQLRTWSHRSSCLEQSLEAMRVLDVFAEKWGIGEIHEYTHEILRQFGLTHRVSGESESCANDRTRQRQRTFHLHTTGEAAYFENHIKVALGFRIHFFCDANDRRVHVGYIGPHLK